MKKKIDTIFIGDAVNTFLGRQGEEDGGEGSGNHNHAGVKGQVGGSAPAGSGGSEGGSGESNSAKAKTPAENKKAIDNLRQKAIHMSRREAEAAKPEVTKLLDDMEVGQTITMVGNRGSTLHYTKGEDGKWLAEGWDSGVKSSAIADDILGTGRFGGTIETPYFGKVSKSEWQNIQHQEIFGTPLKEEPSASSSENERTQKYKSGAEYKTLPNGIAVWRR